MKTRSQTRAENPAEKEELISLPPPPPRKRAKKEKSTAVDITGASVASLNQLPEELLEQIIAHLKVGTLITLTKTGSLIRRWLLAKTDLWKDLLLKHFNETYYSSTHFYTVVHLYAKRRCHGCDGVALNRASKHPFFGTKICTECMETDDYATLTVTRAKAEFRLNDGDITDLEFKTRSNPYNPRGPPIRYYMVRDLRRVSAAKHAAKNTTLEEAAQKAAESKRKRQENRDAAEQTRREALSAALADHGLTLREDSRLCEAYISGRWQGVRGGKRTMDEVVSRMRTMHILHEHTDYRNILIVIIEEYRDEEREMRWFDPYFRIYTRQFMDSAKAEAESAALAEFNERQRRYPENSLRCHCGVFIG